MLGVHRLPLLPAETPLVGREHGHILARRLHGQFVVGDRGRGVPVEYEQQVAVRENHRLVALVHREVPGITVREYLVTLHQLYHRLVEIPQPRVAQEPVLRQRPLPPGVGVAPAVAFAREVDPLGVPELVAHEVEVGLPARRDGHQADHLVQRHAAVDHDILRRLVHVEIHLLVHQPECQRLVAHQRLVVRFGIGHGFHFGQAVGHDVPHFPYVPLLVGHLLQLLDPEVGDRHPQPVVEPDAAVGDGDAHARHSAHVLGDGHGRRPEVVHQAVGERQVGQRVAVDPLVEEAFAAVEVDIAVVVVDHRRHAVEAVAVEMELVEPVLDVRQQEMLYLVLAVVEELRVPVGLVAGLAGQRVQMVGAVQFVDAFVEVADIVGMHQIHDDRQPQLVGAAHQLLQLLGRAAARCGCEETRHVVAERPVIGVLGDGHELHGVVAVLFYYR